MPKIIVDGTTTHFVETGMGDTVILLHSGGTGSAQWTKVFEELGHRCHLVAPDLRGYGHSDGWSDHRLPTLSQEVGAVHALAKRSTGNVHLVGHSYGGSVALFTAKAQPELYDSLTLIEPANFHLLRGGSESDQLLFRLIYHIAMRITDSVASNTQADGLREFVDYWSGQGTWANLNDEAQASLCAKAKIIAYNFFATMCDKTPFSRLTDHGLPTLFIQGENTSPIMERITQKLLAGTRSSRVQVIEHAGHMLPNTHSRIVADLIMDHAARMRALGRTRAAA